MKVLTIIVTFNGLGWIERCIRSVIKSSLSSDIMVIDNGSTDGTVEYIRSTFGEIELVMSEDNLGFGRANNIGLKKAVENNYDYVYLLNQDAWIESDTIEKLIAVNQKHPEYGILSPLQTDASMLVLDCNFLLACNKGMLSDACCSFLRELYQTSIVMAAHWLISRDCLLKTGGFSPTFHHYGEDNNYAQRVAYKGFKVGIVTTAKGVHDRSERVMTKSKARYLDYINGLILLSDPNDSHNLKRLTIDYFKKFLKHPSYNYIKYYILTLCSYKDIKSNKAKAFEDGAFL